MIEGVNLIPAEIKKQWRIEGLRTRLIYISAVYLLCLGLVYAYQRVELNKKEAQATSLEDKKKSILSKSAEYRAFLAKISNIRSREGELGKRHSTISALISDRVSWSTVLKTLSREAPRKLWLRSISTSGSVKKSLRLIGTAMSNSQVTEFVFRLENSPLFTNVRLTYIQSRTLGKKAVYDFEITAESRSSGEGS